ncbi:hypothetical protein KsCSTR_06900 [Candidatus Kuenenia stuttgartiensis]|uniref:Uncharacterized protein n=1 Tax=Kuenenia stuttgartiensis TaxID=174633 RepID=Q1PZN9_KUEST|nr:hypothetical protein KsCSTR_06900 [Candidatus Kuenenia stuttgartiensis]CAJ72552.1 unknown protein [Candidatus Kuenenia stuttgartiensis]
MFKTTPSQNTSNRRLNVKNILITYLRVKKMPPFVYLNLFFYLIYSKKKDPKP